MFCPSCGDDASPRNAKFCESCGASLTADAPPRIKTRGCQCVKPEFDQDGFCQTCGLKPAKPLPPVEYEQTIDAALALASDKGHRHPTNQDFGIVARRADGAALIVVADGVSTSDNAEAASRAAAKAVEKIFLKGRAPGDALATEAERCVRAAAEAVIATPIAERYYDGAASTIVVAIISNNAATGALEVGLAWVGDSRAYVVAANVPEVLLTRDDSWSTEQIEAGAMTRDEAMHSPNAHAITRWLGMPLDELEVHARHSLLTRGSALLLCSDGLWNYVDAPGALARAFTEAAKDADAAAICRALVGLANEAGGVDNITVGLFRA